jgi:regulator-associated protein of mTOR
MLAQPWHDPKLQHQLPVDYPITWRLRERMKTAGVALVVCLNLGTDPLDIVKPIPCARRECWLDPIGPKQKCLETIAHTLQQQYEKWQGKAKYKQCLDPTSEDLRRVCINLRKSAKTDRLLLHYNGHGVPMPTKNGELWVFGKHYTHYMPVAIFELKAWLGEPAIYVLDCSRAGALLPHFIDPTKLENSIRFCSQVQNSLMENPKALFETMKVLQSCNHNHPLNNKRNDVNKEVKIIVMKKVFLQKLIMKIILILLMKLMSHLF